MGCAATLATTAAEGLSPAGGSRDATDRSGSGVIEVEASGNYVDSDLPVAICGVGDLHVIVRNGKVLVCRRGASQLVKDVVEKAGREGLDAFLADPQ